MKARYLFVGERPSAKARRMGVTWEDGRLAAKTLHAALRAAGLDPRRQVYANLFRTHGETLVVKTTTVRQIDRAVRAGYLPVAMGRNVARALDRLGRPYTPMVHPAARGRIRETRRYRAHVRRVLVATARAGV